MQVLRRLVKNFFKFVITSDILEILRPLVYVCLVMRHGKKSWVPIQVSLAIDIFSICLVLVKLFGRDKLEKIGRRDMKMRMYMAMAKYLLRDPIYENYTEPLLKRVLSLLRIPSFIQELLVIQLSYYRYYIFIA